MLDVEKKSVINIIAGSEGFMVYVSVFVFLISNTIRPKSVTPVPISAKVVWEKNVIITTNDPPKKPRMGNNGYAGTL